ncbi:MAG: hypothetical protein U1F54_17115 [Burkholderiales bacterium]
MNRVIAAFFVAPAMVLLLLVGIFYLASGGDSSFRQALPMFVFVAAYIVGATVVVGIPGVYVFRWRGWLRAWQFVVAGFAAGALIVIARAFTMSITVLLANLAFMVGFGLIGAATAWVFWLVAAYRNAWFTPPPEEEPEVRAERAARLRDAGVLAGQGVAKIANAARVAISGGAANRGDGAGKTPG